ncbi:MAG: hypothetical protein M1510_13130 [Nitrospirae bacterium]|nr:hypothetical protein [Nitrospirota bacterium]
MKLGYDHAGVVAFAALVIWLVFAGLVHGLLTLKWKKLPVGVSLTLWPAAALFLFGWWAGREVVNLWKKITDAINGKDGEDGRTSEAQVQATAGAVAGPVIMEQKRSRRVQASRPKLASAETVAASEPAKKVQSRLDLPSKEEIKGE